MSKTTIGFIDWCPERGSAGAASGVRQPWAYVSSAKARCRPMASSFSVCDSPSPAYSMLTAGRPDPSNAAAQDRAFARRRRTIGIRRSAPWVVVRVPGVFAPFPQVAVYVVQLPGVGTLHADGGVIARRIAGEPAVVVQVVGIVAEREFRFRAGPGGEFPFGLARQADHLSRLDEPGRPHGLGPRGGRSRPRRRRTTSRRIARPPSSDWVSPTSTGHRFCGTS